MMKHFWMASCACATVLLTFICAWQYLIDPKVEQAPFASALQRISRGLFGEYCRDSFKIDRRSDAIAYARKVWKKEEFKLVVQDSEAAAKAIFDSSLFRDGGDKDRNMRSDGWLVTRPSLDNWRVTYAVFDPAVAYFSAEFTACGHLTNSASKIFKAARVGSDEYAGRVAAVVLSSRERFTQQVR